ncbi:interleukin-18 receptor accessory protein isoform X1 [Ornithorhynchus anatinus]|uniref:Interleukin 18 receptor accessory protein n=1 Tax=Ornithorhynchus anatinus TaxID=9258 RepID=F7FG48_ORNAN|nr:interleukin-18 receptor accessory protein isoform X1 [Ornithorhynchus anatinus]
MFCGGWILFFLATGAGTEKLDWADCPHDGPAWRYRAMAEEKFYLFCAEPPHGQSPLLHKDVPALRQGMCHEKKCNHSAVRWFQQLQNSKDPQDISGMKGPDIKQERNALCFRAVKSEDAGLYFCTIRSPAGRSSCVKMILDVQPKSKSPCWGSGPNLVDFLIGSQNSISCPGFHCQHDSLKSAVKWYRIEKPFSLPIENSRVHLKETYKDHRGTYVCDYVQSNNSSWWTVRSVVQVRTVVAFTEMKPDILEPIEKTLEVELGKPFAINCTVRFGFQNSSLPPQLVEWYADDKEPLLQKETCKLTSTEELKICKEVRLIKVTPKDLHRTFRCFAQNANGKVVQVIQLKKKLPRKKGGTLTYVLCGTITMLLAVLVASALICLYWIEIILLYRRCWAKDETLWDRKEFDAFVSYAKSDSSESSDSLPLSEESFALDFLPSVLENKYGYKLCLFERDMLPGGAYTDDIVTVIKQSRRGIFILSPNYFSGPSIFELQAAVNCALGDETLKLILIKFHPFKEPAHLPHLVKKALSVLPMIPWKGLKSASANSRFWSSVRYHMPVKNSRRLRSTELKIFPRKDSHEEKPLKETHGTDKGDKEGTQRS